MNQVIDLTFYNGSGIISRGGNEGLKQRRTTMFARTSCGVGYIEFENIYQIDGAVAELQPLTDVYQIGNNRATYGPEIWFCRRDGKKIGKRELNSLAKACRPFGGKA